MQAQLHTAQQPVAPDQQWKTVMPRLPVIPATNPVSQLFTSCKPLHIISVQRHAPPQRTAYQDQVYTLHRRGPQYYFEPVVQNNPPVRPGTMGFIFVILADEPATVYCAASSNNWRNTTDEVEGHTSISMGRCVLYAGYLHIVMGNLIFWDNASGHYLPGAALHVSNLHPYVRRLLPDALFQDFTGR